MELNKNASQQVAPMVSTFATCWCMCLCLIFTEKRHSDQLDALNAVKN
ncbi:MULTISPECIES: hypothetical protein [unclassified Paenibacillus]|jgi:hypothetical protein|nr:MULTISPECIES: hypothetical protein [unclassified Paenibacillus]MDH6369477.1 hypothetical protein [Paenibacillus sp. PastF-3]WHY17703.1 hypothetical protein QNH28_19640 [Paenibacillus sp. G2S3]